MEINEITSRIIGAGILIHKGTRARIIRVDFRGGLVYELTSAGLFVERQKLLPIVYRGVKLDSYYRLDLVVENKVIAEIKCADKHNQSSMRRCSPI